MQRRSPNMFPFPIRSVIVMRIRELFYSHRPIPSASAECWIIQMHDEIHGQASPLQDQNQERRGCRSRSDRSSEVGEFVE